MYSTVTHYENLIKSNLHVAKHLLKFCGLANEPAEIANNFPSPTVHTL